MLHRRRFVRLLGAASVVDQHASHGVTFIRPSRHSEQTQPTTRNSSQQKLPKSTHCHSPCRSDRSEPIRSPHVGRTEPAERITVIARTEFATCDESAESSNEPNVCKR